MHKIFLSTVILAFSLILSTIGFAHSGNCGENMQKMVKSLKLDDAQKQKIMPIMDNLKASMKQSVVQMQDTSAKLKAELASSSMNQSAVNALIDAKAKVIGDMMKTKMMAKIQIASILNQQQKAKWQKMLDKAEAKMDKKFAGCHADE